MARLWCNWVGGCRAGAGGCLIAVRWIAACPSVVVRGVLKIFPSGERVNPPYDEDMDMLCCDSFRNDPNAYRIQGSVLVCLVQYSINHYVSVLDLVGISTSSKVCHLCQFSSLISMPRFL